MSKQKQWSASTYRERKARRFTQTPPKWFTNPETGEHFFIRRVGGMVPLIAGLMPASLTGYALGQWKDEGLELPEGDATIAEAKANDDAMRDVKMIADLIAKSCVIPVLIPKGKPHAANFDDSWIELVCNALAEKYPDFDRKDFKPESIMLDAEDLEESDCLFIYKAASGQVDIELKGGKVMSMDNLEAFHKKPGRRSRASADKPEFQQTA